MIAASETNDATLAGFVEEIHTQLRHYHARGLRLFCTSSFQTHSIPMLHILATSGVPVPVYFLHTGYHFPETLLFRNAVTRLLDIDLINLESPVPKISQRDHHGKFLYASDPDRCCYLNKVLPLEPVLKAHDVWVSGVRGDQTGFRQELNKEEAGAFDTIRYHPLLDWTSKMIWEYRRIHDLPEHPLDSKGYLSIGCVPCTRKFDPDKDARSGRWAGMTKEECGIHTEFVKSQS